MKMQRTHRLSWMVSGWLRSSALPAEGGGTACMTLGCPDDFVAVRLGFPNISQEPWRISRVIGRASSCFDSYVIPTGEAPWVTFTFRNNGEDTTDIVAGQDLPHAIEVRGLGTDSTSGRVRWTWTDWAPLRSLSPDPATGLRVLMLRALIPSGQIITFANGQLRRFTGDAHVNLGSDMFVGGIKFNKDLVTSPDACSYQKPQTWFDNHLVPGTSFPLVQFLTRRPGITGIVAGDSHAQGTGTTEQFRSYGYCATTALIRHHRGAIPFGLVNCAQGGASSATFFARLENLIDAVDPAYALLPGWTYNDACNGINADQASIDVFLARLLSAMDFCRRKNVVPIILTPFPRDRASMGQAQLLPWLRLREELLQLGTAAGVSVIDATPVLGNSHNGVFDGTYRAGMSKDNIHPNNDAHDAIGQLVVRAIDSMLS